MIWNGPRDEFMHICGFQQANNIDIDNILYAYFFFKVRVKEGYAL